MAEMLPVPDYARVSKEEYRALRSDLARTCDAAGYNFYDVWNLVIEFIEKRHLRVSMGRAQQDVTLAEAVKSMQRQVIEDRARREAEKENARVRSFVAAEQAVRELARRDAERIKALGFHAPQKWPDAMERESPT